MSYYLFLDDERMASNVEWKVSALDGHEFNYSYFPVSQWWIVRSKKEFVAILEKLGQPDTISFDHDLNPNHYPPKCAYEDKETGADCFEEYLTWCKKNKKDPVKTKILVHSLNPEAVSRMREKCGIYLKDFEKVLQDD